MFVCLSFGLPSCLCCLLWGPWPPQARKPQTPNDHTRARTHTHTIQVSEHRRLYGAAIGRPSPHAAEPLLRKKRKKAPTKNQTKKYQHNSQAAATQQQMMSFKSVGGLSRAAVALWHDAQLSLRFTVLRGGRPLSVSRGRLVVGDVLLLRAGQVCPCDARVCVADGATVDMSVLTGESISVRLKTSVWLAPAVRVCVCVCACIRLGFAAVTPCVWGFFLSVCFLGSSVCLCRCQSGWICRFVCLSALSVCPPSFLSHCLYV